MARSEWREANGEKRMAKSDRRKATSSNDRLKRPAQTTGSNDRLKRLAQTTGSNDRLKRPAQTTGSNDRLKRPAQTTCSNDRRKRPAKTTGENDRRKATGSNAPRSNDRLKRSSLKRPAQTLLARKRFLAPVARKWRVRAHRSPHCSHTARGARPPVHAIPIARLTPAALSLAVYCASKTFVEVLSEGTRRELVGTGIKITTIQPGDVGGTNLIQKNSDQEAAEKMGVVIGAPVGEGFTRNQLLDTKDIADAVIYAVTAPSHVAVNEILIEPRDQE